MNGCSSCTYAVACKVYPAAVDYGSFWGSRNGGVYNLFGPYDVASGQMTLQCNGGGGAYYTGNGIITTNQWIDYVATSTWTNNFYYVSFYTNGVLVLTRTNNTGLTVFGHNSAFQLAHDPNIGGRFQRGIFGWARIYTNKCLSSNDVYNLHINKTMPNGDVEAGY